MPKKIFCDLDRDFCVVRDATCDQSRDITVNISQKSHTR